MKRANGGAESDAGQEFIDGVISVITLPADIPDPHPPQLRKRDLYHDPSVFEELDADVFQVSGQVEADDVSEIYVTPRCIEFNRKSGISGVRKKTEQDFTT